MRRGSESGQPQRPVSLSNATAALCHTCSGRVTPFPSAPFCPLLPCFSSCDSAPSFLLLFSERRPSSVSFAFSDVSCCPLFGVLLLLPLAASLCSASVRCSRRSHTTVAIPHSHCLLFFDCRTRRAHIRLLRSSLVIFMSSPTQPSPIPPPPAGKPESPQAETSKSSPPAFTATATKTTSSPTPSSELEFSLRPGGGPSRVRKSLPRHWLMFSDGVALVHRRPHILRMFRGRPRRPRVAPTAAVFC